MTRCPNCHKHYKEPEGEEYDHNCPYCGMSHEEWENITMNETEEDVAYHIRTMWY